MKYPSKFSYEKFHISLMIKFELFQLEMIKQSLDIYDQ